MHLPASPEEVQMKMLMHDIHGEHSIKSSRYCQSLNVANMSKLSESWIW